MTNSKLSAMVMRYLKLFLFLVTFLSLANNTWAVNFQVNRAKIELSLPPGWSDGGEIRVENRRNQPLKIRVYAQDWNYEDQHGAKNFFAPSTLPRSAAGWIKFYPSDFTIPGEGSVTVNFVVSVPPDAVGGYYAVLFFETEGDGEFDQTKGTMVRIFHRIASLIYVEPQGTIAREADISGVKLEKTSSGDFRLEGLFQNKGNAQIVAESTFDIISEEGFVFSRGKFNDVYTMPENKAVIHADVPGGELSDGQYDLIITSGLSGAVLVKEYRVKVSNKGKKLEIQEIN